MDGVIAAILPPVSSLIVPCTIPTQFVPFDDGNANAPSGVVYGAAVSSKGAPLNPAIDGSPNRKKIAGFFVSALGNVINPLAGFDSRDIGEKCSAIPKPAGTQASLVDDPETERLGPKK